MIYRQWENIKQWLSLQTFWAERPNFYRELAQAIVEKELLRDFVVGELEIALSPATRHPGRARGLQHMQSIIDSGLIGLGEVLTASMPQSDHLSLAILRETRTEAEQADILNRLAHNIEQHQAMVRMIRRATYAPLFLLCVGFAVAMIFSLLMIPAFEQAAPPDAWTGLALLIRTVARAFCDWGVLSFTVLLLALGWLTFIVMPNATGSWRYRIENATGLEKLFWTLICPVLPVQMLLRYHRDIQGARLLVNLADFLQAGWGLQDALQGLAPSTNPWMRRHLIWILEHLRTLQGDYVGAFSHGILSRPLLIQLHARVRRDAGADFSATLVQLSNYSEQTTQQAVQQLTRTLALSVLVVVMGVNLFFAVGQLYLTQVIQEANTAASIERRLLQKQGQRP